jgi:hypothetical protein
MVRQAVDDVIKDVENVRAELMLRQAKLTSHLAVTERTRHHSELCSVADVSEQLKARVTELHAAATTPLEMKVKVFTFTLDLTDSTFFYVAECYIGMFLNCLRMLTYRWSIFP